MNSDKMMLETAEKAGMERQYNMILTEIALEKEGDAALSLAKSAYTSKERVTEAENAIAIYNAYYKIAISRCPKIDANITCAEQIISSERATERAHERLNNKLAAKKAAKDALSLAKKAKTPEDMLVKAEKAVDMYMEYKKHLMRNCPDFDAQLKNAKDIVAYAKIQCAKWTIQRWIEQYWDLFF
jgi:hypothetical protein